SGKRPQWKIICKDKKGTGEDDDEGSGVDRTSVKIVLASAGTINAGAGPQELIVNGTYTDDMPDIRHASKNPVKKGGLVDDDAFSVQAIKDVVPGSYVLRIEVADK